MASRSLGSLTIDLIARIGGFEAGMDKATRSADKRAKDIEKSLNRISVASVAVGNALGDYIVRGIDAIVSAFPKLIDAAGQFQDLADMTGASAEDLASFALAANTAGVSMDSVASASIKLTKSLVGVDDESKAAGAALGALGLNVEAFKKLDPAAQYEAVGKALGEYADGAGKTAVAVALFGKAGAEQLKVFKALEDQGGRTKILTGEQIALADAYADKQAKLRAELTLYGSAIATQFLEPMNALVKVLVDATKAFVGVGEAVTTLGINRGVQTFAEKAGEAFAYLLDRISASIKELRVLIDFAGSAAKVYSQVGQLDFSGARQTGKEFRDRYGLDEFGRVQQKEGQKSAETFVEAYNRELAASKRSSFAAVDPRRLDLGADGKPVDSRRLLSFNGVDPKDKKGRKDTSAEQEAKARLASDLADFKRISQEYSAAAANNQRIQDALRAAGLVEDAEYYQQRRKSVEDLAASETSALTKTIARLKEEQTARKLAGKDLIDNQREIANAQGEIDKINAQATTQVKVLGIEQEAAGKKIVASYQAADAAARSYLKAMQQGFDLQLAGVGMGERARQELAGLQSVFQQYEAQRQELESQRREADTLGAFGPEAQKRYAADLARINASEAAALESTRNFYTQMREAQGNWINGASEAFANYIASVRDVAGQTDQLFGNAFKGLEDQLTSFITKGKGDFKGLADSITADLQRMLVRQNITGPLAEFLQGGMKSGTGAGGALGNFFTSMFGGGKDAAGAGGTGLAASSGAASAGLAAFTAATASATAALAALAGSSGASAAGSAANALGGSGGGWMASIGDWFKGLGFATGGYTGSGGMFEPAGIVHRGEYVLDAATTRRLGVPALDNLRAGGGMGGGATINVNVLPGATRETGYQAARDMGRELQRARR